MSALKNTEVEKIQHGTVTIFAVDGRLDAPGARRLREAAADAAGAVLMDLAGVDYISSAGLRALMESHRDLDGGDGGLAVCNVHPHVREVLEVSGLLSFLSVHDDRESALAGMA